MNVIASGLFKGQDNLSSDQELIMKIVKKVYGYVTIHVGKKICILKVFMKWHKMKSI